MSRSARKGVSLAEVLVVLAIIAILIGLFLPNVRRVRTASDRAMCLNNLKQVMLALHSYESTGRPVPSGSTGRSDAPVGQFFPAGCLGPGITPEERLSWMVAILPYLEQESLYRQFDNEKGYAANLSSARTEIKTFLCPASKEAETNGAVTHYVAMAGIGLNAAERPPGVPGNGFMGYDRQTSVAKIEDGLANTIALMETRSALGPWARGGTSTLRGFDPADLPLQGDQRPFGGHEGGMSVAMADGSARFIRSSIEWEKLAAAITIDGGEPFDLN